MGPVRRGYEEHLDRALPGWARRLALHAGIPGAAGSGRESRGALRSGAIVPGLALALLLGRGAANLGLPAGDPREAGASPVVVVVRVGALSPDEISPGSGGASKGSWSLVLGGTTLARLTSPPGGPASREIAALRSLLFSPELLGGLPGGDDELVEVDLPDADSAAGFVAAGARSRPLPLRDLETLYGDPGEPSLAEAAALESLGHALRGGEGIADPAATAALETAARVARLGRARAGLLRLAAAGASVPEVETRDALLERIVSATGTDGHLLVVNLPDSGEGSAFLRGPSFEAGRVLGEVKSFSAIQEVVASLVEAAGTASELSPEARKERIRAILR